MIDLRATKKRAAGPLSSEFLGCQCYVPRYRAVQVSLRSTYPYYPGTTYFTFGAFGTFGPISGSAWHDASLRVQRLAGIGWYSCI